MKLSPELEEVFIAEEKLRQALKPLYEAACRKLALDIDRDIMECDIPEPFRAAFR